MTEQQVTVQRPLNLPRIARMNAKKNEKSVKIGVSCGKKESEAAVSGVVSERLQQ